MVQYHLDPLACGAVNELADRVRLRVEGLQGLDDLDGTEDELRRAGVDFGGDMITGRGGRQALALDPSGNLVELIEAYERYARLVIGVDDPVVGAKDPVP